ncbi:MAG: c-type cytochrome, partial [Planctomycetales bacterium]|nr:c-type cytochrome [Planctomycetales bacterium]
QWAGAGLLVVVAKNDVSPEAHSAAVTALNDAWQQSSRQTDLMLAATKVDSHFFDRQILAARENLDVDISQTAARAIELLQIEAALTDTSPLVKTLDKAAALELLVTTRGNVQLGKQAFAKANCTQCHSLTKAEVQKGPFLGSIARTYKRPELALAVMEPSKTIAQGFATNIFETVDGKVLTGFVTDEQSTQVTFRDNTGKETTLQKDQIEERRTSPISVMPEGVLNELTINEAASLLDFIQSLAEQVE